MISAIFRLPNSQAEFYIKYNSSHRTVLKYLKLSLIYCKGQRYGTSSIYNSYHTTTPLDECLDALGGRGQGFLYNSLQPVDVSSELCNQNFLCSHSAQEPLIHSLQGQSPISEEHYQSERVNFSTYWFFPRFRPSHISPIFHDISAFQTSHS